MKPVKDKELLWYCLGQVLVLIGFYCPWLSGSSSYFFRDLTHYIEPFARFSGAAIRQLQFPLWNPWCYCGMSQIAITLQNICYPPSWIFALMPFSPGLASIMVLHQFILGLGGFLLIRSLGWGLLPSVVAGTTLSFSGYCFCFTSIFSLVQSAAWCPIVIWAIRELGLRTGNGDKVAVADWTALAALLFALQILAGYPDISAFELAIILAFVFWSAYGAWRSASASWPAALQAQLKAIVIGVFLAMPLVLPACEWLQLSRRSSGLDPHEALILSANWYDLLGLILPQALGDMQLRWSQFRPLVMEGQLLPYMATAFVGPAVISMAFWGIADRSWKERYFFLGLTGLFVILALGINTPLVPALLSVSKIPIRFPVKLMFFVVWCLAILAARGLKACLQKQSGIISASLVFWILTGLAGLLLFLGLHPLDGLMQFSRLSPEKQGLWRQAEAAISAQLILVALLANALNLGAYLFCKLPGTAQQSVQQASKAIRFVPQLMIVVSVASLLYAAFSCCYLGGPPDYFERKSWLADLLKQKRLEPGTKDETGTRILGLYLEHFTVPQSYLDTDNKLATIKMYEYSRQVLRTNTNLDFKLASSAGFEGSCTGEYYFFFHNCYGKSSQAFAVAQQGSRASGGLGSVPEDGAASGGARAVHSNAAGQEHGLKPGIDDALARFCQMTATGYVLTQVYRYGTEPSTLVPVPYLDPRFFSLEETAKGNEMNLRIYQVKNRLPRAYFSDCWEWVAHSEALNKIFNAEKSGFDPDKKTLIEMPSGRAHPSLPRCDKSERTHGPALSAKEENSNSLTVELDAPGNGFVILADQNYPGWVAELDGKKTEIMVANCFTRAVPVSKGKHRLRFSYQPQSFYGGLVLSGLALLWLALLRFLPQPRARSR